MLWCLKGLWIGLTVIAAPGLNPKELNNSLKILDLPLLVYNPLQKYVPLNIATIAQSFLNQKKLNELGHKNHNSKPAINNGIDQWEK